MMMMMMNFTMHDMYVGYPSVPSIRYYVQGRVFVHSGSNRRDRMIRGSTLVKLKRRKRRRRVVEDVVVRGMMMRKGRMIPMMMGGIINVVDQCRHVNGVGHVANDGNRPN